MLRSMMGPIRAKNKGDPTDYRVVMTRGVPQGAPSSPIYFNVYLDELATEGERRAAGRSTGEGAALLVADDVLLQASTQRKLQELLDASTFWKDRKEAEWSESKCSYLQLPGGGKQNRSMYVDEELVRVRYTELCLGMTLGAESLREDHNWRCLAQAGPDTHALVNRGQWSLVLRPCQSGPALNALFR